MSSKCFINLVHNLKSVFLCKRCIDHGRLQLLKRLFFLLLNWLQSFNQFFFSLLQRLSFLLKFVDKTLFPICLYFHFSPSFSSVAALDGVDCLLGSMRHLPDGLSLDRLLRQLLLHFSFLALHLFLNIIVHLLHRFFLIGVHVELGCLNLLPTFLLLFVVGAAPITQSLFPNLLLFSLLLKLLIVYLTKSDQVVCLFRSFNYFLGGFLMFHLQHSDSVSEQLDVSSDPKAG